MVRPAGWFLLAASVSRAAAVDPGRFAWVSTPEPAIGETQLDLREPNPADRGTRSRDAMAGLHGPLRRQGDTLVDAGGHPARFWGLRIPAAALRLSPDGMAHLARRLSRSGVNLVRIAPPISATPDDPAALAGVAELVAVCKREGIATDLVLEADADALLVVPSGQARWRSRARALLTLTGTGISRRLGWDPAVVLVEVGGGSVFGTTMAAARVPELAWQKLENTFADWTRSRYGSLERARAAWLEAREPGDDPTGGWLALYDAWHLSRDGMQGAGPGLRRRAADEARFLGGLEQQALEAMARFLRRDLKVRALVLMQVPGTVDDAVLQAPAQDGRRGADAVGMAASFTAGGDLDAARGTGTFTNRSVVEQPECSPFRLVRPAGQPCLLTGLSWPPPNLPRAEGPWLAAVLGGTNGLAGIIWDDPAGAFGEDEPETPGTAAIFGSFPACAAVFRGGMVRAAPPAVVQTIEPDDLWSLAPFGRESVQPPSRLGTGVGPPGDLDPLAFIAGPVLRTVSNRHPGQRRADLAGVIDRELRTTRNLTGEVVVDAAHGVARLDTPRAQGVAGFLSRLPAITLSRITVNAENDFAAILAVALDGVPLDRSRRILVQVMTTDRPTGFRAAGGADGEIQAPGGGPWTVERIRGRITLAGGTWTAGVVRALDARGIPLDEQPKAVVAADGGAFTFPLAPTGIHYLVTR